MSMVLNSTLNSVNVTSTVVPPPPPPLEDVADGLVPELHAARTMAKRATAAALGARDLRKTTIEDLLSSAVRDASRGTAWIGARPLRPTLHTRHLDDVRQLLRHGSQMSSARHRRLEQALATAAGCRGA
jgi:hypothetical protein